VKLDGETKNQFDGVAVVKSCEAHTKGKYNHALESPSSSVEAAPTGRRFNFRDFQPTIFSGIGESMGMTPDGILKFNCDISFTNMRAHPATGEQMSIPPDSTDETGWTTESFPKKLRERSDKVKKGCYGAAVDGMKVEAYRMCWYVHSNFHYFFEIWSSRFIFLGMQLLLRTTFSSLPIRTVVISSLLLAVLSTASSSYPSLGSGLLR
jgi:hypothetical protein